MRRRLAAAVIVAAAGTCSLPAHAMSCSALTGERIGQVQIERATPVNPAAAGWQPETTSFYKPVPVHVPLCRIEGRIEGNIGFELWLPDSDRWNGRMLGAGVGGDAGVFNYADMSRRIAQGFATVTSDSGHKPSQAHWMSNPKARVDYEHRAVHLTALAAKALIARYYSKPAARSYFLGCSGGGRQALKEMQDYPADYDGVVAGAPGPYMPLSSVRMMWFSLMQKQNPAGALSDGDWALYERATIAACDTLDGVKDGIMEDPRTCRFRPSSLLCAEGQSKDCLSAPKLAMLEAIVRPMTDERGRKMDAGLLPGVRTRPGPPSPLLRAMWADGVYNDPDWDETRFQRTRDLALANKAMPELRADSVAIAPFIARGGKAIIYQGWQDPSVIAGPTVDYYERLAKSNGGAKRLARAVRLFMVPGMYHCANGPGPDSFGGSGHSNPSADPSRDILWALIDWVEKAKEPERIEAEKRRGDTVVFTHPLCAFPRSARYVGGDTSQAASFVCDAPVRNDPQNL
jgi:feruloyl esterase